MKKNISILLSVGCTIWVCYLYSYYSGRAVHAECESLIKDIGNQLELVKKEYGTYKSGLNSLKFSQTEKCRIVEGGKGFDELLPTFNDTEYRLYFYTVGDKTRFGKLESGILKYLN